MPPAPIHDGGPAGLCAALTRTAHGADLPQGPAMALSVLVGRVQRFDASDPRWPDRDRLVLSCPRTLPLLRAVLDLTGQGSLDIDGTDRWSDPAPDIQAASQTASQTDRARAGSLHPALEGSGLPGGQSLAIATGLAVAERIMAARFGKSLVDHRIWAMAHAASLGHGTAQEAALLAGRLGLGRLALLADATAAGVHDARARYGGMGWAVKTVPAQAPDAIEAALSFALRSRKPTLIWCVPGSRSSAAGIDHEAAFDPRGAEIDMDIAASGWLRVGARGTAARRAWLKRLSHHPQRLEFERVIAGRLPDGWHAELSRLRHQAEPASWRGPAHAAHHAVDRLAGCMPELLCHPGSSNTTQDAPTLNASTLNASIGGNPAAAPPDPGFGGWLNGIAVHGGLLPCVRGTLQALADQLSAIRVAALSGHRMLYLATEPPSRSTPAAWHPIDALCGLRALPRLLLFRPGSPTEVIECLELALRHADGPSVLVLATTTPPVSMAAATHHRMPDEHPAHKGCARGGYVLAEADGPRQATLIATGAELAVAQAARALLAAEGIAVAVVSLPCFALFAAQDEAYRQAVLGNAARLGLEAGARGGWDRWLGPGGLFAACGSGGNAAAVAQQVRQITRATVPAYTTHPDLPLASAGR